MGERRFQYEAEVKKNPLNYDSWFDYIRLEEAAGDYDKVREVCYHCLKAAVSRLLPNEAAFSKSLPVEAALSKSLPFEAAFVKVIVCAPSPCPHCCSGQTCEYVEDAMIG